MLRRGEDEVFVGGSAGGGKSEVLVINPLRQVHIPHYRALILRKTYKELEELLGKAERYYPRAFPTARFNGSKYVWTFPSGANYMGSRNRPNGPGTFVSRMSSGNPGGVGHGWVKDRFITAAKPTERIWEKVEIVHPDGHVETQWLSRVFIPSSLFDNKILLQNDPAYAARLASMPEKERNALLYGDWDSFAGMFFEDFRTTPDLRMAAAKGLQMSEKQLQKERRFVHVIDPFEIPNDWKIFRSFGRSSGALTGAATSPSAWAGGRWIMTAWLIASWRCTDAPMSRTRACTGQLSAWRRRSGRSSRSTAG